MTYTGIKILKLRWHSHHSLQLFYSNILWWQQTVRWADHHCWRPSSTAIPSGIKSKLKCTHSWAHERNTETLKTLNNIKLKKILGSDNKNSYNTINRTNRAKGSMFSVNFNHQVSILHYLALCLFTYLNAPWDESWYLFLSLIHLYFGHFHLQPDGNGVKSPGSHLYKSYSEWTLILFFLLDSAFNCPYTH